ncbi:hypothetical protein, partial [Erwinia amylovora]|uniref:hypothetical protein n=1 Tax=Erwinia amylovora TaxID=552 RepID=UPI0020C13565
PILPVPRASFVFPFRQSNCVHNFQLEPYLVLVISALIISKQLIHLNQIFGITEELCKTVNVI